MIRSLLVFCLCLGTSLFAQDREYELGRGVQVGDLPLYVGGYFSVNYNHSNDQVRSLELDELAIMTYGEYGQWSYMLEIEAEDVYSEVIGNETEEASQEDFHIERLYFNYDFNDNYAAKLGKYNSPIGFWNQNPINVLRDTSSNPVITSLLFPRFTSGVDLLYRSDGENSVSVNTIIQIGEDLDALINKNIYNNFDVDLHYGLGVSVENEAVNYQLNTGYFEVTSGESYYYLLGALEYSEETFKVQAEMGTQFDESESIIPYIGYIQYVQRVEEEHEVILRFETYKDERREYKDNFTVIGYTYRPFYAIALKSEYQWHTHDEESGFMISFSMLF